MPAGGNRTACDLNPALLAGAMAPAGRVDRNPVPAGGVEDAHAGRNPDLLAGGLEGEIDACGGVSHEGRVSAFCVLREPGPVGGDPRRAPLVVAEHEVGGPHRHDDLLGACVHDRAREPDGHGHRHEH